MINQRIHALLVEDDPGDVRLIRNLLSKTASVHVTWQQAEQLSVATDLLRETPFDIVLLDLSLPDSQGLESFRHLYPHAVCLPIVILATVEEEPQALLAVQAGAQDYIVKKKVDGEVLIRTLRQAIERKHIEIPLQRKIRELTGIAQQLGQAIRIGYELNNSLMTVLSGIEALLEQIPVEDRQHTDLQLIHDEVDRLGRLAASLVQFSYHSPSSIAQLNVQEQITITPDLIQSLRDHNIITVNDEETYFLEALEAGTAGYILKGSSINELVGMIQRVMQGGVQVPLTVGPRGLDHYLEQIQTGRIPSYEEFSPREREVLQLIARGRTNKEIAKRFAISVRTVERHRSSIMNKLGLQNRAQLVTYAVQRGLLSGEEAK